MTRALVVLALIGAILLGFALFRFESRLTESEARIQGYIRMNLDYVKLTLPDGKQYGFARGANESATAWASRIAGVVEQGMEVLVNYKCTTLTGCTGGISIQVCTACVPGQDCQAAHDAEVAAFCEKFDCDC